MSYWEYDPIPRYRFCIGEFSAGYIVLDKQGPDLRNDWNPDGEVWRAVSEADGLIGRYPSDSAARIALRDYIQHRGLKSVAKRPASSPPNTSA